MIALSCGMLKWLVEQNQERLVASFLALLFCKNRTEKIAGIKVGHSRVCGWIRRPAESTARQQPIVVPS
jgi:hypothetical protein